MKKIAFILLIFTTSLFAQTNESWDASLFFGMAIEHDDKLNNAIKGAPYGMLLSYSKANLFSITSENKKDKAHTFSKKYNYPDKGFSLLYQNFSSDVLGHAFGLYRHYTFYLNKNRNDKKHWFLKTGFGLAYNSKPYDAITNNQNIAFGSHIMLSAFGTIGYSHDYLWNNIGVNAGVLLTHYSNASIKNPNLGLNTLALNVGLKYHLDGPNEFPKKIKHQTTYDTIKQPIRYNAVFRTGLNQSKEIGSKQYPFYHFSAYASKRINYFSTLTAGTDLFISPFIKEYIPYHNTTEFDNQDTQINTNRVGIFVGHELHFDYFSFVTQLGYHVHQPFEYVSSIYERVGFKHQINDHLFTELSLKINLFRAEGLEFGIGYRF